jgi:hypothetical protein
MQKRFSSPVLLWFAAVCFQALLRFGFGPWAQVRLGVAFGNFAYVFLRAGTVFGLALLLASRSGLVRFRALSAVALATLVEHVGFNLYQLSVELRANPQELVPGGAVPGLLPLLFSFMFNLPVILIIAFAGYELGRRSGEAKTRPAPPASG